MTIQLLKIYLEAYIYRYKNDKYASKNRNFFEKTMKPYSKATILPPKNYENILKFNILMSPLRHIDYLGKYFDAVIYCN